MMYKPIASILAVSCLTMLLAGGAFALAPGDTLVGDVFVTGFDGWTDTHVPIGTEPAPNWGVLLMEEKALSESNNIITGADTSGRRNDAISQKMINLNYETPSDYTIEGRFGSWDDDGYGIVFAYEDEDNYFRVGFRQQASDTYGFPMGISLVKVVGGTQTLLAQNAAAQSLLPDDGSFFFDASVTVTGNTYSVKANPAGGAMVEYLTGTDGDLPDMAAGHYGVHSWAQKQDSTSETGPDKQRGTMVESVTVTSATLNKNHVFSDVLAANWRRLQMTNAEGAQGGGGEDAGNFRQDFRNGTIVDDSNSYEWATVTAPNVDFIGAGVVIDEAGSADWSDYELKVRVTGLDDEGPGILLRVQDDETFYRVNFAKQGLGTNEKHSPLGMSIQKCDGRGEGDPVWTELFRDDQESPLFVYTDRTSTLTEIPFDVTVRVVGNGITVSVDEVGAASTVNYATVYDTTDPILSGTVGFTNWGGGDVDNGTIFSAYGGEAGGPLLTAIPEPSSLVLLSLLALFGLARRRS